MKYKQKKSLIKAIVLLYTYLDNMDCGEHVTFTSEEVEEILKKEDSGARKNYDEAIKKFLERNDVVEFAKDKRFIVYWGYPGGGKSMMTQKLIERFANDEDCLPFNIIDKDDHRDLFPNLFNHLKDGHIDECERFAGVTIDYVREILDLTLQAGQRSVLSVGSMGAGNEFTVNAKKAMEYGYKPCAVYMAVNPDIAYLSSVYRCATYYDQIIFQNNELYPRLVSKVYFNRLMQDLPVMIDKIDAFQKENAEQVDLMVVNRANELLYDTRKPHVDNVREVIEKEENRALTDDEATLLLTQIQKIHQNMQYRYENDIYAPCRSEVDMAKIAIRNIAKLINKQPIEYEKVTPYFKTR